MNENTLIVRQLGRQRYMPIWQKMQDFTDTRDENTPDEIWLVEHESVFTQGQAGKDEHLLAPGDIEVIKVDRGGQVTYHGPGQQMMYVLFNLRRLKIGVRELVTWLEECIIESLAEYGIEAYAKADAPGVYVNDSKIASLGLRVRRGCSFHGLALNVNMDLSPFLRINPCGYAGMNMVQTKELDGPQNLESAGEGLVKHMIKKLNATQVKHTEGFENE
ncbi:MULTISPECIES: lipoyl(octanoyl) transferase LipB [Pseudoalteromonas]|uniref:Octanoyltransferase n=5 Tax=Gammaproteobacteria TaxID=1236 RepID=A0A7X9U7N0_9GAMM|nr:MULTISPECIES: lipoyl(octanoyl) transferase LipB [Pseudoalteromonas]MBG9999412.1 lipoyl(octanoyl) transferase LipB [Pseudoalteromonas sp. NSLLW24]MBH0018538.1 lipoyl(octanoyl) transferase LipB [Pseudoalteromonas sp. NGC95]MBH0032045.1 lipoyl(octanoyl) transferase LipB [Pseudoalteromonas sp. SWYJZ98]MBH0046427.1 lipoyl(octanoyl) transferase LipB [Pseudoalteromonas sp. NZS11_1]MBH0069994.1 lipoyl(octanoyl) transferase LipB [Pseudoalteromonas sp. NZS100]MBH0080274.1 lipoyl(octanoyl) transferas